MWLLNSVLPALKALKSNSYLWVMPCICRICVICSNEILFWLEVDLDE
ncbi:hypothetical protein [Helicobacter sp. T3_23-1056]